ALRTDPVRPARTPVRVDRARGRLASRAVPGLLRRARHRHRGGRCREHHADRHLDHSRRRRRPARPAARAPALGQREAARV
ncbi:MAG: hypothetical protein AVDCRST_MAG17-1900, partial [uncultured Solirubrobacterales bacterium]